MIKIINNKKLEQKVTLKELNNGYLSETEDSRVSNPHNSKEKEEKNIISKIQRLSVHQRHQNMRSRQGEI